MQNWAELAKTKSDEELFGILSTLHEYRADAALAYRNEFESRQMDPPRLAGLAQAAVEKRQRAANMGLSGRERVGFLLNPLRILMLEDYRFRGELRKWKEARQYLAVGMAIWAGLILIGVLRHFNILPWIGL